MAEGEKKREKKPKTCPICGGVGRHQLMRPMIGGPGLADCPRTWGKGTPYCVVE